MQKNMVRKGLVVGIMILFIGAGVLLSINRIVKVDPLPSYIIVHALNPEGVEIASIEINSPFYLTWLVHHSVRIYDGNNFIGYGAHNDSTYNKPISLSAGTHTIKVKFNGMELYQNVNLQEGETKVLTFEFPRTEIDRLVFLSGGHQVTGYVWDYWIYDTVNTYNNNFFGYYFQATDMRYAGWQNYWLSIRGSTSCYVDGIIQYFCDILYAHHWKPVHHEGNFVRNIQKNGGFYGEFHFSSVPYDITGSGIKYEEVEPPVADFTFEEYQEYNPSGIIDKGMNLMGKKVIIDTSSSKDPDGGEIVDWEFTINGRYIDNNSDWLSDWDLNNDLWPIFSAYFPRGDYMLSLSVKDDEGMWSEPVTKKISISLLDAFVYDTVAFVIIGPGINIWGDKPDATIYYKYDGDYYFYILWKHTLDYPFQTYVYTDARQIHMFDSRYVPDEYVNNIIGNLLIDPITHKIIHRDGLGIYIGWMYEWQVLKYKDVGQGFIKPSESHPHNVIIDPYVSDGIFTLTWPGSDLDLVLYDPNGREINPGVAVEDNDIDFFEGDTFEQYKILYPLPGNWIMLANVIGISEEGEEYKLFLQYQILIPSVIDIDPDTLNLKSKGKWITCYIELPDGYNVEDINISTTLLNEVVAAEDHPTDIGDYDNDGFPDLMVKFDRQKVIDILEPGNNVEITVAGELMGGTRFEGTDYIRVI